MILKLGLMKVIKLYFSENEKISLVYHIPKRFNL